MNNQMNNKMQKFLVVSDYMNLNAGQIIAPVEDNDMSEEKDTFSMRELLAMEAEGIVSKYN